MRRTKKWLALLLALCMAVPTAAGTLYTDVQTVQAAEQTASGSAVSEMFTDARDNQWIFTGGSVVAGGFAQTRGARNYVGQFEEYVRWTIQYKDPETRQRFTFNTAKAGLTLSEIVADYEKYVSDYKTKAAVYMVGEEDYLQGTKEISAFKKDLKIFIDKSLELKEGKGFAVIQTPFAVKLDDTNAIIDEYCGVVRDVVAEYSTDEGKYSRIVIVDHYAQTNTNDFKTNRLQEDGKTLNAKGHLELAKQFASAMGQTKAFTVSDSSLTKTEVSQPEEYSDIMPEVTATKTSLKVKIADSSDTKWKYEVQLEDMKVSGNADSGDFEIVDLPEGASYVLKIQTQDGKKQLVTTKGLVKNGETAVKYQQSELSDNQKKIAEMAADKDTPMTWLFMGDSITHAMTYTYGYDGIAQSFEKYIKEDLGRTDDIVLNTAVANATSLTTVEHLDVRLSNYDTENNTPDVVSIMLGTNDCSSRTTLTPETYQSNMETILDKIQEINPEAVIILRSPTPVYNDANREPYIDSYIEVLKELAETYDAIYVDQYTELGEATSTYSWLIPSLFPDNLHPSAQGQRILTNQLIRSCGIWTEDSTIGNLFYDWGIEEISDDTVPVLLSDGEKLAVSVKTLETESGAEFGEVTLKATSKTTGQTYEATAREGENYAVLAQLPKDKAYHVEVSGYRRNAAKKVTFASQDIILGETELSVMEVFLSSQKVKSVKPGVTVGTFSADGLNLEGSCSFSLCDGEGSDDNELFTIQNGKLKIASELTAGNSYKIRVRAVSENVSQEKAFVIRAVTNVKVLEKENISLNEGDVIDLSSEAYVEDLYALEEGTVIVNYTSDSEYVVQSLFSIGNGTNGNTNRHFHVYVRPNGRVGCEIRNDSGLNYHIYADNAVTAGKQTTVAFKADKENHEYKLFVNGNLVATADADTLGGYAFVKDITGVDNAWLGATKRNEAAAYTFGGTIHKIQVYSNALEDEEIKKLSQQTAETQETLLKAGSISVSEEHVTEEQPFASGTAGSKMFRIPALITLKNGELLAAADARWTGGADWGGLDTIAAVSDDQGKTWQYSFPIYFPDSNEIYPGNGVATTAIDPVLVQGPDETIYCIADMNPSGITTGDIMPSTGTGFVEIDGEWRLALTGTYVKPTKGDQASYGDPEKYEYYVGDFDEEGFAPVLRKEDNSVTEWGVDEWYNIYTLNEETGAYEATLTQSMVNDTTVIQQNAFYKDSVLHVFSTGYLWMVKSTDNGRTWESPQILNTQIKRDGEVALLASPGQGIVTSDGDIIIPFYDHGDNQENASVIWSDDNGETWHRSNDVSGMWSSESEVVELHNGVLRMFFRNGNGMICYADITKENGVWTMGQGVQTSIPICSTCNVTAIRYSETIEGKMAVLVACPGGSGRANGKIFTFLVDENNQMELFNTYSINQGYYAYSCMTEMENGNIGLLWENQGTAIRFDELKAEVVFGYEQYITLDPEESYVEERAASEAVEITQKPDEKVAVMTSEYVVEESVTVLHDHGASGTADSVDWFQETAGLTKVSDAEFTFIENGEYWTIYNEKNQVYLRSDMAASYFGEKADMKVEMVTAFNGVDKEFRICKADGTRYVMFWYPEMNFNSNSGGYSDNANAHQEMILLEKQEVATENDVIPGYQRATELTSGKSYLIAQMLEDGNIIILYPTNGKNEQTKLVGATTNIAKNVLTITGVAPGKTTAVAGNVTYHITVADPTQSPSYAGNDYPVELLTAIAGTQYTPGTAVEGPASMILDGNASTHWHSNYGSSSIKTEAAKLENRWVGVILPETTLISGIRYLPRENGTNGDIKEYQVQYRTSDDGEWISIEGASGTWTEGDKNWKKVSFDTVEAKQVRIVGVHTYGSETDTFMSAAEFRVVKGELPAEKKDEVIRLSGSDRYATGMAAADELKSVLGVEKFDTVVIATGKNYADALSGSYLAAVKNAPILLTSGKAANVAELHAYIKANVKAGATIYVLGGEAAVSKEAATIEGYDVTRLAGGNRYETNLAILAEAGYEGQEDLLVATGKSFADSLSASAASRPILLVKPDAVLTDAQKAVAANFANIYVIGGTGAVSEAIAEELAVYGNVTRLSGASRYETSVAVAEAFFTEPETVVLAYGKNFPDGLCGGALAAALNAPLILTKEGNEDAAAAYVAANGIASGYVLGGDGVLPNNTIVTVFGLDSADDIINR